MSKCKNNNTNDIQTLCYPGCIEAAKEIISFISRFKIDSAAQAIFCINSWHKNRSSQSVAYALNAALLICDSFGSESITDFASFSSFFSYIKEALPAVAGLEDEVLPVMGQALIPFRGKWHQALYSCGATLEYPRLCFSDSIIDDQDKAAEFNELLDYVGTMSRELGGGGWDGTNSIPGEMHMPSPDHWNRTRKWMESNPLGNLSANTIKALDNSTNCVENKYMIMDGTKPLPLFCPSILEDYLTQVMAERQEEKNQAAIDIALLNQARAIFDSIEHRGSSVLTFPLFIVDGELLENAPSTFLILDGETKATLFYNASCHYDDKGLEKLKAAFCSEKIALEIYDYEIINGQRRKLVLKQPSQFDFTVVAYHDNVKMTSTPNFEEYSPVADYDCGAADLMAILCAAKDANEICSFFQFVTTTRATLLQPFAASSDLFIVWSISNRQILSGTEDRHSGLTLALDFNETDRYFVELFNSKLADFPINHNGNWILGSPFAYILRKNERGFTEIIRKSDGQSMGLAKRLPDVNGQPCFINLKADINSARDIPNDIIEQNATMLPVYEDILMCITNDAKFEIADLISDRGILDLIYVMPGGADANNLPMVNDELGIKAHYVKSQHGLIYYTVESASFCRALSSTEDRSAECHFAKDVLSQIKNNSANALNTLSNKLSTLSYEGKMVDAKSLSLPYRWQSGTKRVPLNATSKAASLKAIAYAVEDKGIEPGRYFGEGANKVIRNFQGALSKEFEKRLAQFDKEQLLVEIYEVLANAYHYFFVDTKRYNSFSHLEAKEGKRIYDKILDEREESRYSIRAAQFSIETLLTLSCHGNRIASSNEIAELVNIGGQLLEASDAADMLMFNPKGMGIEIAENCVVTVIENNGLVEQSRSLRNRQLRDEGHAGSDATADEKFIKLAKDAFEADTGIPFACFIDVLSSLSLGKWVLAGKNYLAPNIMSINKHSMVDSIEKELPGIYSNDLIKKCVDFLTLDNSTLKEINGKQHEYLPFGMTKTRSNRLELKPLIKVNECLLYSPICTGLLQERWIRGIAERFLPAKLAFPSLSKVIENWKHLYEKALEKDVEDCFLRNGFSDKYVFRGIELHKKGDHPRELGDYDGLAYDQTSETVWVIECKEFEKIESAYDYMQLQQRWFGENGKLLKYERRIKYLQENLDKVAADLGFEHTGSLKMRPYLVSNKLFINTIGESNFEVITLSELNSLIERG